ncbi:MAG TPA: sigma-70 family RNA polymerase sigma factor [Candidatus Saccharimonadales bacterium]|nr:sigma-70 family RNA polymerase sigma factor [Candidatus Saccharimonadales bacterium]
MEGDRDIQMVLTLRQAAQGSHEAFGDLVRQHQTMVFSIAYHFLRNRAQAEDVAQEVFLELYKRLNQIESPPHLTFWLRRVTVNRCIDQTRRRKPELALEDVAEPKADSAHGDPLLSRHLQKSVANLPERRRAIIILRYQEEMDLAEIAEVLEMPLNTVKSTLQRSLLELRKKLTRKLGEVRYAIF